MQAAGLTARDLFCQRGGRVLFARLGLTLAPGDAVHVVGANGAGKTTLIRMLAGLLRPAPESRIDWHGTVGLIGERPALDENLPLGRALGFWAAIDGGAAAPLETLGLAGLADVPVRYLSTGQRKRAAFARLLGQNAANWLLDEPLNGLDAAGVALVEGLVARHRAGGGVAVVASHQPVALPGAAILDLANSAP